MSGARIAANKEIVLTALRAVAAADYPALLECLHEDIEFYVIGSTPYSGLFRGTSALVDDVLKPLAGQRDEKGFSETIVSVVAENNFVVTETRGQKNTMAGDSYDNEYLFIFELHDGRIARWRCYLDTQLLAETHQ